MHYLTLVTVLVLMQYIFFGALVAKARPTENVPAPSVQGTSAFNALHRVHQNTLERLVAFLPLLWTASMYWTATAIAAWGVVSHQCAAHLCHRRYRRSAHASDMIGEIALAIEMGAVG
jgi:hypothetical protein